MANFMEGLNKEIKNASNVSFTENGALGYATTHKTLLDLNFMVSSMRSYTYGEKFAALQEAYKEDPKLFTKWLFMAGDVRGGMGERDLFRVGMDVINNENPYLATNLLGYIPDFTRWDNLVYMFMADELKEDVLNVIHLQLEADILAMHEGKPCSLLAKWMPSENTSSDKTRRLASDIRKALKMTPRNYRKTLSSLRKYIDVVERKMSAKQFSEINYNTVPSKANIKYANAFMKNDYERRNEYLKSLEKGEAKINGSVNFPYEVYRMQIKPSWTDECKDYDPAVEGLWKALKDSPDLKNTLVICDGSGSMETKITGTNARAIDVSRSLAIYFAERCSGPYKDTFITFSSRPQIVSFKGMNSFHDKVEEVIRYDDCSNTDIERVFDMVLKTAVENKIPQEEIPNLLIVSDMEFDSACNRADERLFEFIAKKYHDMGYQMPKLIFWNVFSRSGTIPVTENNLGVALVSGFSQAIVKMIMSSKTDPWEILLEQINSPRYDIIGECCDRCLD